MTFGHHQRSEPITDADWRRHVEVFRVDPMSWDRRRLGARPGHDGCRVPLQILREFGFPVVLKFEPKSQQTDNIGESANHNEARQQRTQRDNTGRTALAERVFTADALQTMTFPPLNFILPGIIPEGATLLASKPKLGKSWLVLDLALATAAGRLTLGELKPVPGDVLYLALEDGKRRLQRRLDKLLPTFSGTWPPGLSMATEWPRADQGGLPDIETWITSVQTPRLIIIDTLAKFRKPPTGKQVYTEDYAAISDLQKLAGRHGVAIIVVHHTRKGEAEDEFDTVSGTLGLTGAADTIIIMKRHGGSVTLHVRGRDTEEAEKALQFQKSSCKWAILGEASEVHRSVERQRILVALEETKGPMTPKEIMLATGMRTRNAADQLLFKMKRSGEVMATDRGQYCLPNYVPQDVGKIGKKERPSRQATDKRTKTGNLTNLTNLTGDEGKASIGKNSARLTPDQKAAVDRAEESAKDGHAQFAEPLCRPLQPGSEPQPNGEPAPES